MHYEKWSRFVLHGKFLTMFVCNEWHFFLRTGGKISMRHVSCLCCLEFVSLLWQEQSVRWCFKRHSPLSSRLLNGRKFHFLLLSLSAFCWSIFVHSAKRDSKKTETNGSWQPMNGKLNGCGKLCNVSGHSGLFGHFYKKSKQSFKISSLDKINIPLLSPLDK